MVLPSYRRSKGKGKYLSVKGMDTSFNRNIYWGPGRRMDQDGFCLEFTNHGTCRFGNRCWYQHVAYVEDQGGRGEGEGVPGAATMEESPNGPKEEYPEGAEDGDGEDRGEGGEDGEEADGEKGPAHDEEEDMTSKAEYQAGYQAALNVMKSKGLPKGNKGTGIAQGAGRKETKPIKGGFKGPFPSTWASTGRGKGATGTAVEQWLAEFMMKKKGTVGTGKGKPGTRSSPDYQKGKPSKGKGGKGKPSKGKGKWTKALKSGSSAWSSSGKGQGGSHYYTADNKGSSNNKGSTGSSSGSSSGSSNESRIPLCPYDIRKHWRTGKCPMCWKKDISTAQGEYGYFWAVMQHIKSNSSCRGYYFPKRVHDRLEELGNREDAEYKAEKLKVKPAAMAAWDWGSGM